ncbi:MAG: RHS repeat-associated core domain-containing protein, partial [Bdellovibrionia bacterium]
MTGRGIYAWYLREARSAKGEVAVYYYFSDENRLYLDRIEYGGMQSTPEYQIKLIYIDKRNDQTGFAFLDYRSSDRQLLRLRIAQVSLKVIGGGGHSNEFGPERYRYEFSYLDDPHGAAFTLSKLVKVYASGESEPPKVLQYHSHDELLETSKWHPLTKLDKFSAQFPGGAQYSLLSSSAFTPIDLDNNGLMGFEYPSKKFTAYRQLPDAFETIPLSEPSKHELLCRMGKNSRSVMRLRGPGSPLEVVVFKKLSSSNKTEMLICDREGNLSNTIVLQGSAGKNVLGFSPKTRFADLNHTGKPDLIFSNAGSLYIYKNISTPEQTQFEATQTVVEFAKKSHPITDPMSHLAFFMQDVNGDGILDLILQLGSGFCIYYGKGIYEFDPNFKYVYLENESKTRIPPKDLEVIFQDLNGDGISEVLAKSAAGVKIFNWTGEYYKEIKPPIVRDFHNEKFSKTLSNLSVADYSGSGNIQVTAASLKGYFSAELTKPSTGLLKSIDDGKGNVLQIEYKRPDPNAGLPGRSPVIAQLQVKTTGKDSKTTHYNFHDPMISKKTGGLLGYGTVEVLAKNRNVIDKFFHGDDVGTLAESSREFDTRQKDIQKLSHTTYEDRIFRGIPYKRVLAEAQGLVTDGNGSQGQVGIGKKKEFSQYQDEFCPSFVTETSTGGHLTRKIVYEHAAAFPENLTCFEKSLELTGHHDDSSKNFSHSIIIERETHGLPIRIYKGSQGGNRLAQSVQYNAELKPIAITETGKGTTQYQYDTHHRLMQVQQPDGVVATVEAFAALIDTPLAISTKRGQGSATLLQSYAYDGLERLLSQWRNLFQGASSQTPEVHFQYQYANLTHPGWVSTQMNVFSQHEFAGTSHEVSLQSGTGEKLGTAHATDSGWVIKGLTHQAPDDFATREWGPKVNPGDIQKLSITELNHGGVQVEEEAVSALGFPVFQQQAYQAGIQGEIATNSKLTQSLLALSHLENHQFSTMEEHDFEGNKWTYKDESGALTRYEYDALNRFTGVTLPLDSQSHGNTAHVSYDAEGKVLAVKRAGIGKIDNAYDPVSGLLISKVFYNTDGSPDYQLKLSYDSIGRMVKQRFSKLGTAAAPFSLDSLKSLFASHAATSSADSTPTGSDTEVPASEEYELFYDGHQPNGSQVQGQLGFLTGVKGPKYTQTMQYTLDGNIKVRDTLVLGAKPIREEMAYYSDGTLFTRTIEQEGHEKSQFTYLKDRLGRMNTIKLGTATIAHVKYNALQKIGSIHFSDTHYNFEYDTSTGRLLGFGPHNWSFNNRGLISNETNVIGSSSVSRAYQYSASRELTSDQQGSAANKYSYSTTSLITGFVEGGDVESKINLISSPNNAVEVKTKDLSLSYGIDLAGRVTQAPVGKMIYGPNGRLEYLKAGEKKIRYGYDQDGVRLVKMVDDHVKEIYLGDYVISDAGIISSVKIGGVAVGVVKGNHFKRINFDVRGTALEDDTHADSGVMAYGARSGHRIFESPVIDYAAVGYDPDLKAYRMEARDYDPVLKRFLTPDSLFLEDPGLCVHSSKECNLYGYAGGNPVSFVDPTGKYAHIVAGAMFGAAASGVSVYVAGARGNDLISATTTGAIAGAAAASGGAALAAGVSFIANGASQMFVEGKSVENLNISSMVVSGAAGALGAGVGSMAGNVASKSMSGLLQYEASAAFSVGVETTAS